MHGFTGSPYEMRGLGDSLAAAGYTVLGVRLPGHGNPPGPEANEWPAWQAEVDAGFESLRAVTRGASQAVVGLSMGALLTLDLAARFHDQIRAVVALSPAILLGWKARFGLCLVRRSDYLKERYSTLRKEGSDIRDAVARAKHPVSPPVPMSAVLSFALLQRRSRSVLASVKQSLLIVHARGDRTCPLRGARLLARWVGSRDVEMHVLQESGHVVTVDLERETVTKLVLSFLSRKLG